MNQALPKHLHSIALSPSDEMILRNTMMVHRVSASEAFRMALRVFQQVEDDEDIAPPPGYYPDDPGYNPDDES